MSTEQEAFGKAIEFFKRRNWRVEDVCRLGKEHSGCDLVIRRDEEMYRVEVKGTRGAYKGIPDLYGSEVDANGHLVADFLLVVFMPEGLEERFALIPRDDFPNGAFQQKIGYRIKPIYKNERFIGKYLRAMTED